MIRIKRHPERGFGKGRIFYNIKNRRGLFERIPVAKELLVGEGIYFAGVETVILIVSFIFFRESLIEWTLGFMEGAIIAAVLTIHMAISVEDSVAMQEAEALKHTRIAYIIRVAGMVAAFLLIIFLHLGNIAAALFGLMSLKVSAYIQPFTHKVVSG